MKKFGLLKIALTLFVVAVLIIVIGKNINREIYEIGILLGMIDGVLISFGTIQYAMDKGRSGYWGIFGFLGLGIVFFLAKKTRIETPSTNRLSSLEYLLSTALSISLIGQGIYITHSNFPNLFLWLNISADQFLIFSLITLGIVFYSLFTNRRLVFVLTMSICAVISFISLLFYPVKSNTSTYFVGIRNWFFLCLIIYPLLHLLIHGLMNFIKRPRKMITPEGIVSYQALIYAFTFLWGAYDLIQRITTIIP